MNETSVHRRGIPWFLALTFLPSWGLWVIAYALGHPLNDPVIQLITAAFLPALAAFVVRVWITRQGFADAGLRPRLRERWRWYLLALAVPFVLFAVALPVGFATGVISVPPDGAGPHLEQLLLGPLVMVVFAPVFFGEEFGWTAYLRGALADLRVFRNRPTAAAATTGAIWGAWHWPLASVGYFGFDVPLRETLLLIPMWIVMSVLLEIIWSTLWYGSGTIWTTSIAHTGFNLVFSATLGAFVAATDVLTTFVLAAVALAPIVVAVMARERRHPDQDGADYEGGAEGMFEPCSAESWESRPSSVSRVPSTDTVA
ncbi:CPBP family glutamic-type intramembrane protease [Tsukamurella pseudospumae]|uniref:CAAX prenyl protease 2/Lysostaphin resistance protein A-like domain-containing protein n=1 Tax=Tsukamurella pseudospumae TaxID=239498 RepID=A0A138AX04_9ACTN|nr:CPBP family glutamic-type intramembrane protease [Tsukamurella pseudospumae]KXP14973.1 hypothetical protein AXK60_03675 [Tsukamurella pseudospumae]